MSQGTVYSFLPHLISVDERYESLLMIEQKTLDLDVRQLLDAVLPKSQHGLQGCRPEPQLSPLPNLAVALSLLHYYPFSYDAPSAVYLSEKAGDGNRVRLPAANGVICGGIPYKQSTVKLVALEKTYRKTTAPSVATSGSHSVTRSKIYICLSYHRFKLRTRLLNFMPRKCSFKTLSINFLSIPIAFPPSKNQRASGSAFRWRRSRSWAGNDIAAT